LKIKAKRVYLRRVYDDGNGEVLVAVCDAELLGKRFKQGRLRLEVKTAFYQGELSTIEEAMRALAGASVANLVGEETVRAAVREGFVDPRAVIRFGEVPHVQMIHI